jgi:hypothetical protein
MLTSSCRALIAKSEVQMNHSKLRFALLSSLFIGCAGSAWYLNPWCCVDGSALQPWISEDAKCIGPHAGYDAAGNDIYDEDPEWCRVWRFPGSSSGPGDVPTGPPYRVEVGDSLQRLFFVRARNDPDSLIGWAGSCSGEQVRVSVPWAQVQRIWFIPGPSTDVWSGNPRKDLKCVEAETGLCCDVPEGEEGYQGD